MQTVLLVIHLLITLSMIGIILIQRSEGGGMGLGGGNMGGLMSTRGTANLLTHTTAILAGCFFVTSLGLAILASQQSRPSAILDGDIIPMSGTNGATTDIPLEAPKK